MYRNMKYENKKHNYTSFMFFLIIYIFPQQIKATLQIKSDTKKNNTNYIFLYLIYNEQFFEIIFSLMLNIWRLLH